MPHSNSSFDSATRRWFLSQCGVGLGAFAASGLLNSSTQPALGRDDETNDVTPTGPMAPRPPHFPGKAKAVIHLFMCGAPSQLELFDEKPLLKQLEGKPLP
ncbi:MAG: DUF1501 domain-containing protein, partial [Planctomycetota bacterium]